MNSTSLTNPSPFYNLTKSNLRIKNNVVYSFKSPKCVQYYDSDSDSETRIRSQKPSATTEASVADKLKLLVGEFKSLHEPIDRVKRLLHYAMFLDPMDESARVNENRVTGCTAQVWLEVKIDECGRMRFKADSDSEITKGFCSCLVWMMDGAEAREVLAVEMEDLEDINLGLQGKTRSRVITWQNVLIMMKKRTSNLVTLREGLGKSV